MRSDAVCFQLQQNEVRFGGICLDIFPCGKLCEGFSSFFGNEGLCFLMELKIRKDMLTDKIRKAVYAPEMSDWRKRHSPDGCRGRQRTWRCRG